MMKEIQNKNLKQLQENEMLQAFLLKLSDALRPLSNPVDIEDVATNTTMNYLDADRCHYSTIEGDYVIILRDAFRGDLPSVAGIHPLSSFPLYISVLNTGRPFVVEDVQANNIIDENLKKVCLQSRYGSFINIPVIKNGKLVGLLSFVQVGPRVWTDAEVQLGIEIAERIWTAVERAKAEDALFKSEEKYRTLFNSIDEGISTIDVIFDNEQRVTDFRFIENNPAFTKLTGLPEDVIGKRWLEYVPTIDPIVAEIFEKVIRTGEAVRAENYVKNLDKWHNTYFILSGGSGSNRITCVYSDITERKQAEKKIKESESRFRSMADASPVLIWSLDANGLSSYYNKTFLDFIGASQNEDISDWSKIVHPEDVQYTLDTINTAIAKRHSYSLECRLLRADGEWRWVLSQGNPSIDVHNQFLGFVGTSVDIAERKQAEAKIAESEMRYHNMIYSSPSLIAILKGEDMIIEIANDAILESWGKGKNIIGKSLISIMPEIVEQGFEKMLLSVYKTGEPVQAIEMPVTLIKNGKPEVMHYTFVYQAQYNAVGEIEGVAIIANEVTRQVELNKKIKDSEKYFQRLTDTVPAIIWITEPDGYCTYLNKNWYSYTGQTEAEAKGFGWLNATHPDDKEEIGKIFLEANAAQKPFVATYRLKVKNGSYRWAIDRGSPKFNENGEYEGMIGTVMDVHEEKLAEEKLAYRTALLEAHNQANVDGVLLVDAKGKIISFNQRFVEIWNMPQHIVHANDDEAALSFAMTQLVNPQQFIDKVKYLYDHPTETSLDELEFSDGKIVERNGYPVIGNDGKYYAWSWTFKDITQRKKIEEDLKNTQEQLELTFKNIPAGVYLINEKGEMVYVNEVGAAIYGDFTPEYMLEQKNLPTLLKIADELFERFQENGDYFSPQNSPAYISLNTGKPSQTILKQINRSTREQRWYYVQGAPLFDEKGNVSMVLITSTDITEQKNAEEKIKNSEERFRTLAQSLPQLVWVSNAQGIYEFVSERWKEYTGIEPGGENEWKAIVHPDDFDNINAAWMRSISTGSIYRHDVRLKSKSGEYRWHTVVGEPTLDKENNIVKWVGAFTDVHEQKEAAEKIKESENQFSILANNIQNLAWIADADGWIYWYNQRWYDYTGTTLEEMKGWGWEKVHHPEHIERVVDFVSQAWKKNEPFEMTFPLRRADGKFRWFLTQVFPVNDANGNILRWVGTNTDIEKQKTFSEQLEEKVKERTIQLNEVNENLEQKNIELLNKNKELEAFTYISSHDLQEPLRKIQTFAGKIIDNEKEHLSENAKDYFNRMQSAATRMQKLIRDLLEFSRVSNTERVFEKTDLNQIVEEEKEELRETIEAKNATIEVHTLCELNIIPFQFQQLIYNLLSNAIKFSKPGVDPHIIIKSEIISGSDVPFKGKKVCHISISDNGIGFDPKYSDKIFGVFQRLHAKEEFSGTGIGLAIVKKIVDNHNGIINAKSEFGKGATFNIYIPVT